MSTTDQIEHMCEVMHDAYEKAAAGNGWETQQASRKPWADVPEANKATMRAAVMALLDEMPAPATMGPSAQDQQWNDAIDWLLNSPIEPDDMTRFNCIADGLATAAEARDGNIAASEFYRRLAEAEARS